MSQPLTEYLKNKDIRKNLTYRYNGATGKSGYILAGSCLMSEESIKEMYPLSDKLILWHSNHKGDNPDKTAF